MARAIAHHDGSQTVKHVKRISDGEARGQFQQFKYFFAIGGGRHPITHFGGMHAPMHGRSVASRIARPRYSPTHDAANTATVVARAIAHHDGSQTVKHVKRISDGEARGQFRQFKYFFAIGGGRWQKTREKWTAK